MIFHHLLHGVYERIALVVCVDQFQCLFVFFGMSLGIFHHALNFFFAQAGTGLNLDFVLFAGGFVFGRHMQNTVGVDVKRDFNLWHAAR